MMGSTIRVELVLRNDGTRPAEGIEVELHFPDDLALVASQDLSEGMKEPAPPAPPKSRPLEHRAFAIGHSTLSALNMADLQPRNVSEPQIRKSNSYDVPDDNDSFDVLVLQFVMFRAVFPR